MRQPLFYGDFMTGIVDVGGGNRGAYGAGVFDRLMDENIKFDICIGVSAGSANVISYTCSQRGRNYRFYHDYAFRKEYMSLSNLFSKGEYIDLDYVYSVLSNSDGEDPLDFAAMSVYPGKSFFTVTDARTGKPLYFGSDTISEDDYKIISASCSIPIVCGPTELNGCMYFDGGLSDPVPYEKALSLGCDKLVVILTKPKDYRKSGKKEALMSKLIESKYPVIAKQTAVYPSLYNDQVDALLRLEAEGKCLIIAPDNTCGVGTVKKDKESIDRLYRKGYEDAAAIREYLV